MAMSLVKATDEQQQQFIDIFHVTMGQFIRTPLYDFDVVKFDEWLGTPDGVSLQSHLISKHGVEAFDFIYSLRELGLQY